MKIKVDTRDMPKQKAIAIRVTAGIVAVVCFILLFALDKLRTGSHTPVYRTIVTVGILILAIAVLRLYWANRRK